MQFSAAAWSHIHVGMRAGCSCCGTLIQHLQHKYKTFIQQLFIVATDVYKPLHCLIHSLLSIVLSISVKYLLTNV